VGEAPNGSPPPEQRERAPPQVGRKTLSIIGVYPPEMTRFPIGAAMNKNLTLKMGNCDHRTYIPELVRMVASGSVDITSVLTQEVPFGEVMESYHAFDHREPGWTKVAVTTS
jgi:threonine dehydrogenase-like Zn-dependent dehydrogenase